MAFLLIETGQFPTAGNLMHYHDMGLSVIAIGDRINSLIESDAVQMALEDEVIRDCKQKHNGARAGHEASALRAIAERDFNELTQKSVGTMIEAWGSPAEIVGDRRDPRFMAVAQRVEADPPDDPDGDDPDDDDDCTPLIFEPKPVKGE